MQCLLLVCVFSYFTYCGGRISENSSKSSLTIDDDAIRQLGDLFGITDLGYSKRNIRAHEIGNDDGKSLDYSNNTTINDTRTGPLVKVTATVSAYMINLYNTIADPSGVMRLPNPYYANIIKSFPNKHQHPSRLFFDLKSVDPSMRILQAELHITLHPRASKIAEWLNMADYTGLFHSKKATLHLYIPGESSTASDRKLLLTHKISLDAPLESYTQVLQIQSTAQRWIDTPHRNNGLSVELVLEEGNDQSIKYVIDNSGEKPTLVLFMDDGRINSNAKYRIKDTNKRSEYVKLRAKRLGQADIMRSFNGNEAEAEVLYSPAAMKRTRVQRSPRKGKAVNRVVGLKKYRRRPKVKLSQFKPKSKGPCQRHDLYVSFEDIGWSSWIISPKGFQAYHCRGDCHFPIGQESKPSNHATVISIINHMKFHKRVSAPCCVPDKLYSISLLYFDNEQNVILKQYDDMVAQSCACR